jgi:ATP-binding cassette subfamily B multidrug efflux pump
MIMATKKLELLAYLKFILKFAFNKYKGLYVLSVANILSVFVEFLAIAILSGISQPALEGRISFLQGFQNNELFIIFICLFLIRCISLFFLESWIIYYAKELQVELSSTAFSKVMHENIKEIEKVEIGHYLTLTGDEASNASQLLISMTGILNGLLLISVYLISVMVFSNEVFLGVMALLLLIMFCAKAVYKRLFSLGKQQVVLRRKTSSMFVDAFNGLRVLKSFSLEAYAAKNYKEEVGRYFSVNSRLTIVNYLNKYIPIVLLFVFFLAYLFYFYFNEQSVDTAYLITLLFILMRLLQSLGVFSGVLGKIVGELKGVHNIVSFIKDFSINEKRKVIQDNVNEIKIDNLSFSYGDNKVFEKMNFSFSLGGSYAIYGESGVGKSTLLDLIMDFVSPQDGQVLINNINVKEIEESSLTKRIMYVGQESLIFNKTIRENIELDDEFNNDELMNALKLVKLDRMVEQLDDGIDQILFYKGTNISGGQRQRINLARALIRKPDVLILDEATSALDQRTKDFILDNILKAYKSKILIIVTHDPSVLPLVTDVVDLQVIKERKVKSEN